MVDRRRMRKPPQIRTAPRPGFAKLAPVVAAVDAAKHTPAWAVAEGGELKACGFDPNPGVMGTPLLQHDIVPDVCVLEASRSYGMRDSGKHGDILAESIGGALCAGSMRALEVVLIHPDEWAGTASSGKGSAKPARHARVWEILTPGERSIVARASESFTPYQLGHHIGDACEAIALGRKFKYSDPVHNLLDAVGLLLFAVGRMGRGGSTVRESIARRLATPTGKPYDPSKPLTRINRKAFLRP